MSVQVHAELVQLLAGNAVIAKTPSQGGFHCLTLAHALMAREGLPADQVDPDAFLRFGYARLLDHRQPRYAAMAQWGVTVTAEEVAQVRSPADFDTMIATAIDRQGA